MLLNEGGPLYVEFKVEKKLYSSLELESKRIYHCSRGVTWLFTPSLIKFLGFRKVYLILKSEKNMAEEIDPIGDYLASKNVGFPNY